MEDKFDGLELNHIPRRLNEAGDALAKAESSRELDEDPEQASNGLPALGSGANQPLASSNPKVMELDEDPAIEPDPLAD